MVADPVASDTSVWLDDLSGRLVSIDVETTNFPHLPETRIIEFGAVEIVDGQLTDKRYSSYVACSEESVPGAFQKHKLSVDFLMSEGVPISQALEGFMKFIGDSPLMCHGFWHGVNCDEEVINNELARLGLSKLMNRIIQTTDIFGFVTLQNLCKRYGVHDGGTHNALRDAEMLAEVCLRYAGGQSSNSSQHMSQKYVGRFVEQCPYPSLDNIPVAEARQQEESLDDQLIDTPAFTGRPLAQRSRTNVFDPSAIESDKLTSLQRQVLAQLMVQEGVCFQ